MRLAGLLSAVAAIVAPLACLAQTAQSKAAPDFRNEALVFEQYDTTVRMRADGTGERVIHARMRIQSEGAARQFGVLSFSYASANETPHIALVRVHKPGGAIVDTPVADAIDMPAAVTREAPLYSDLKEKHLPVRSLSVGDTLEYEVRTSIDKAEAPGHFWGAQHFTAPGTLVVLAEVLTLEVPKEKYVQVWSPNHKPIVTEHDGLVRYSWSVPQLIPPSKNQEEDSGDDSSKDTAPKDPDEDESGRKLPSVAWTTFRNWADVGDWYRSLASSRAQPNDALRARADEITRDAKTPEDQIRAIYAFVSSRTRYVGIDFGIGRYQPHPAAEVLANQYGDCKDKDTLLEALLRAKGFQTAPALIGVGIAAVADVATPAVFNHVITTVNLPSGRIWLDATPEVAPYRYLSSPIRDQQALVVPAEGPAALERTPAAPPYPFVTHFEASGALDAEGKFTGKVSASYRNDDELIVRALARGIAPAEWDKASQYLSSITGFSGTTSNTHFTHADDISSPVGVTYDYTRHPYGDWDSRRIVSALPALEFSAMNSAPPRDIDFGAPRTLTAISRIRLPEGYRADLPDSIHVRTDFATFDKTYAFDGKEIVVERNIAVLKSKLPKAEWKRYQRFTKDISLESEPWIQLIAPKVVAQADKHVFEAKGATRSGSGSKEIIVDLAPQPETNGAKRDAGSDAKSGGSEPPADASTDQLMQYAMQRAMSSDWSGAKAALDKVKAKNPETRGLWGGYGMIAQAHGNLEEAEADFKKELAAQPDNAGVVGALAYAQKRRGDSAAACRTLQGYLDRNPGELRLSRYLATLQTADEDYQGALKTLQSAADQNPEDRNIRLQLSQTLLYLGRKDEAAAAARSAADGTDDPSLQNGVAYMLAEAGLDLASAEEMSRKSIATLEERSAGITTAEVNSRAFAQANELIASWDTFGWILFREGKAEEAKPWITASWRNALRPEVGDHLGQLYEAMGKNDDAASAYALAEASLTSENATAEVRRHIKASIARLRAAGAKAGTKTGTGALQDSRTYEIPRPEGVGGWGTFRLQITTAGVVESRQMSGEQKLAGIAPAINAMKFPGLVPPQSKAHLLRSAVVSCSMSKTCQVVLVPGGGLQTEQQ